jgi:hypothetical protein
MQQEDLGVQYADGPHCKPIHQLVHLEHVYEEGTAVCRRWQDRTMGYWRRLKGVDQDTAGVVPVDLIPICCCTSGALFVNVYACGRRHEVYGLMLSCLGLRTSRQSRLVKGISRHLGIVRCAATADDTRRDATPALTRRTGREWLSAVY